MHKTVVYLAGKMSGLTREEMTEWRRKAADILHDGGMRTLNPTNTILHELPTGKEIVTNNKFQINHSNIVLAEFDFDGTSLGTISEVVYAGVVGRPVVAWGKNEIYMYPWINENIVKHFTLLEDALEYIVNNYYSF